MFACVGECVNDNKGLHLFNGEMSVWEYADLGYINCYLYRASILLCRRHHSQAVFSLKVGCVDEIVKVLYNKTLNILSSVCPLRHILTVAKCLQTHTFEARV